MPQTLRQTESKELGNGWVKGALVPIKSHYSRLIMQGSCCFHRYKQWIWYMNNSASKKDTWIQGYSGIRMGPRKGPKRVERSRKENKLICIAIRSDLMHP